MAPFSKMQQLYATASGILSSYVPLYPEAPHEGALSSPFLLFGSPSTGLNSGCEFVRTTSFFEGVVYTDNSGGSHDSLDHTAFTPMRHYWESECDGVRTRLNTLRSDPSVYEGISFFPNGSYTSFAVSSFDGSTLHHAVSHAGEPDHNQHQEYVHRILELPSWTPGCYPDDTQTHEMGMGVALTNAAWENAASGTVNDWVFYGKLFGRRCYDEGGGVTCTFSLPLSKEEKIQAIIDVLDQAIGFSNSVIKARMNFNFKVKALHIATVPTFLVWNKARSDCSDDIASTCSTCDLGKSIDCDVCFDPVNQLTAQTGFTEWTKSPWCPDTTLGLWLLMDKSCLVGTTIGVSNSALCQGAAIVHASSSSDVLYLTMAHEIGHNLGMEHLSIEEDGIMEAYVPVGGLGAAELRPNPEIDSSTSGIGYNDVWRDSVCTRLSGLQTCSSWKIEQSGGVPSWYPSDNVATVSEADCEVQIAINDEREKAGLSRLPMDRRLHQAAHDYAIYMLHTGFWGHDDAEGRSCRMRAAQSGYESRDTRENIAQGQRSAARVTNAWMNSDGHKRNLLSPGHEHTGVVRVDLPGKSPMWVQLFSRGQEDKNQWVDCGGRDWEGAPTDAPTTAPVAANPTKSPTRATVSPTLTPTASPMASPTASPSKAPKDAPTKAPVAANPTKSPTRAPTDTPTKAPVAQVTDAPITSPPTPSPTSKPTSCIDAGKSVYIVQRDNPTVTTTCSTINGKFQTKLDQDESGLQQSILQQFFDNYCLPLEKNWIGSGMTCCETCKQAAEALGISVYPPATTPPSIPVPTSKPTDSPTSLPTRNPTPIPTRTPTNSPTLIPTANPTSSPTDSPTSSPTDSPTLSPIDSPTSSPTDSPTSSPVDSPTSSPTDSPTSSPTDSLTLSPIDSPTSSPTDSLTSSPTDSPTSSPTDSPTSSPTDSLTSSPTDSLTSSPTDSPTSSPTDSPTSSPTVSPTSSPTPNPTSSPTTNPTSSPIDSPTSSPIDLPTLTNTPPAATAVPTLEVTIGPTGQSLLTPVPTSPPPPSSSSSSSLYIYMWDDDGFGWDEAEVVIHKRMDSRALETSSEGDKTFTLAPGQVFLQVSFILDPGCYDMSTITERQSSSGGGWAIVQVFSDFNTNLKRRTLGGDDANWLCTAGFTLPKRCKDNPTAMDCQDQERAKSELKNRGIAVPSPSPTAQVDPQPQTVQTDTGDSSTDPVVYGVAGALILSAVAVGATVLTMRRRRRLSLEEDDNPWVTNTPLSPPTMKVVRAMDGNSHLVE